MIFLILFAFIAFLVITLSEMRNYRKEINALNLKIVEQKLTLYKLRKKIEESQNEHIARP